jgi:hypothetical protein
MKFFTPLPASVGAIAHHTGVSFNLQSSIKQSLLKLPDREPPFVA